MRSRSRQQPRAEQIASSGTVTGADRAQAVQLADYVREVLVSRMDSSWLDDLAAAGGFTVTDRARMPERLPSVQRSALRGLLTAALASPDLTRASLSVRLEPAEDAVRAIVDLSLQLPAQRRRDLLAPYFLTLKSVSEAAQWQEGERLRLRFQLPALPKN